MSTPVPAALGTTPSFGFGDRLGSATPGHLAALKQEGGDIKGIFAQQSIREMSRTQREPFEVMSCAANALADAGFNDVWGADADHLKTPADVDYCADAGFVFYTIDPSDHVDQQADGYDADEIDTRYEPQPWVETYLGKTIEVADALSITFDELTVKRAAVKYGKAIVHALQLANHIKDAAAKRGQEYEIEISVDETEQPTTLAEHYIIADQCRQAEMKLVSLAPRFIGELEKGVDYKGNLGDLERSIRNHAQIAKALGPYKLSLHSGSDKVSMYELFARATEGLFHVKTAGTSYLEALRVVARHDEPLFRRIIDFSRDRYAADKATYHVSATVEGTPPPSDIADARELERIYLGLWDEVAVGKGFTDEGRQILHCTFGSVLTDTVFGTAVQAVLDTEPETYKAVLTDHFGRHLAALRAGMD